MNYYTSNASYPLPCIGNAELRLHDMWRSLWEQHVAWTRMTIISAANQLPDLPVTAARLLQNAADMGAALSPYYGNSVATGFSSLIRSHLQIALQLVNAAKTGDSAAAAKAEKDWYANGADIALFLSSINPFISREAFQAMFYEHLALTKAEAVAILSKDYTTSVQLYDRIELDALAMADVISAAIFKQFQT
jgi:hypothetical protein